MMRWPDRAGAAASEAVLAALGLQDMSVQAVTIDWQTNEVAATVYVLDKQGRKVQGPDGGGLTTVVRWPAR